MDERVFDVSKPHKVNPGATSKPVIVGHHPEIPDPMIRENAPDKPQIPEQPEFGAPEPGNPLGLPEVPALVPEAEEPLTPTVAQPPEEKPETPPLLAPEESVEDKPTPASSDQPPPTAQMFNKATGQTVEPTHSSWKPEHELPISGHHHKGGFKKTPLIIVGAVLTFMGIYALLDSGLIVEVDLPVHIFSPDDEPVQSQQQPVTQSTVPMEQANSLPEGWQLYENEDLGFRFAYPESWGVLSINNDNSSAGRTSLYFSDEEDYYVRVHNKDIKELGTDDSAANVKGISLSGESGTGIELIGAGTADKQLDTQSGELCVYDSVALNEVFNTDVTDVEQFVYCSLKNNSGVFILTHMQSPKGTERTTESEMTEVASSFKAL